MRSSSVYMISFSSGVTSNKDKNKNLGYDLAVTTDDLDSLRTPSKKGEEAAFDVDIEAVVESPTTRFVGESRYHKVLRCPTSDVYMNAWTKDESSDEIAEFYGADFFFRNVALVPQLECIVKRLSEIYIHH